MRHGIINLNKAKGITSFDAVRSIKRLLNTKQVGHAGTLDPLATGVLTVMVGFATKVSDYAMSLDKSYRAKLCFGGKTDTLDSTGVLTKFNKNKISDEFFDCILESFRGLITQVPPMYSAIKLNGIKMYELARKGQSVEIPSREVFIYNLTRTSSINGSEVEILVKCSKGTYIRTLIDDIGNMCGCYAYMTELERVSNGVWSLDESFSIDEINEMVERSDYSFLRPIESLFHNYPKLIVNDRSLRYALNGVSLNERNLDYFDESQGTLALYYKEKVIGLCKQINDSYKIIRVFRENLDGDYRTKI